MNNNFQNQKGLTLIELIIAISIGAILAGTFLVISNPVGQVGRARNSQRNSHINAIANAIKQNMADTRTGVFTCAAGNIPTSSKRMAIGAGNYDIAPCLVPTYIQNLPFDPALAGGHYVSVTDYDTGYNVSRNASTSEITVSAPGAELSQTISVTR